MSETETRLTISEYVAAHKIRMTVRQVDRNPLMDDERMDHWRCTLMCDGRRVSLVFSMGMGHHGAEPKIEEVLSCMARDSHTVDVDFEDWCREYGYDSDSRKANRVYQACVKQHFKLRKLVGSSEAYDQLLFGTEAY